MLSMVVSFCRVIGGHQGGSLTEVAASKEAPASLSLQQSRAAGINSSPKLMTHLPHLEELTGLSTATSSQALEYQSYPLER